ncbi:MAG: hypothetical protein JJU16_01710 [Alkalibacterium sp.]|nr:hypothetical protein [Alkalibacterium sp.]
MFTLGRKIDPGYKTNQIIILMTFFTAGAGWMYTGDFLSGLSIGLGVFLTWALSREVDPRHEYSAFAAAALSLLNLFYYDSFQFLEIAWLLLLLRMTTSITGKKLTILDAVLVLSLTTFLSFSEENSVYLIPFIFSMVFFILIKEKTAIAWSAGGTALGLFIIHTIFLNHLVLNRVDVTAPLTLVTTSLLLLSLIVFWFISKAECEDDNGNRVSRARLLTTQVLFSLTILLLFLFTDLGLNNLIIYLSVSIGVMLYYILLKLLNK